MGNFITDNIDIWTSAIVSKKSVGRGSSKKQEAYGIKKLRELILELAVRGKLVPQDESDESATVLLDRIVEEKERLIAEGKLKKQKNLPKIEDKEIPFSVSENWEWVRLGNVTNYGIFNKVESTDVEDDTWVLELEDIEKTTSKLLKKVRYTERKFRSSKNYFQKNSVIYGKLRPYLDKVIVTDEEGVCSTEMIPLIGYKYITPHFLRLVMKSPYFIKYANSSTHGMNLPRLGTDKARLALFPLLSENEQTRIVKKVDELMLLCDKLEEEQEKNSETHQILVETLLDTLTNVKTNDEFSKTWQGIAEHFDVLFTTEKSIKKLEETILQLAVMGKLVAQDESDESATVLLDRIVEEKERLIAEGKLKKQKNLSKIEDKEIPFSVSKNWEWVRLGNVTNYGVFDKVESDGVHDDTWVLELEDIEKITSKLLKKVRYTERKFRSSKNYFQKNSVIYGKLRPYLDKVIVTDEEGVCSTEMIPLRGYKCITPHFLRLVMKSPYFIKYANSSTHGMNLPRLGTDKARLALIPILSENEQIRIVKKVDELMALCDSLRLNLREMQTTEVNLADSVAEMLVE